jgi:hypothetical protein
VLEQGIWRLRIDQELRELRKDLYTVADIIRKRLEWIGHVVGMDQGKAVKKIFVSKPEGSRTWGRSRMRWLEDVEKSLREVKGSGDRRQSLGKNGRP